MPHEQIAKLGAFFINSLLPKTLGSPKDISLYFYRNINYQSGQRQQWLETFKGIKIFRDNFRVRPMVTPENQLLTGYLLG